MLAIHAGSGRPLQRASDERDDEPPPRWLIRNVTRWLPLVERWSSDFPELEHALILSIIAQESQGFPDAEANDGWNSVGLMQIIPRSWTGTREQLLDPPYNIYVGMRMMSAILAKTGGDLRTTLASYNCGGRDTGKGITFKHCRPGGGLDYADRILSYWLPVFRAELRPAWTVPRLPCLIRMFHPKGAGAFSRLGIC